MNTKGIGIDIVEVDRIGRAVDRHGMHFLNRIYTETELEYCLKCAKPQQHFAARFAAKEAVLKALGTGWQDGTRFTDIEVVKNEKGAPAARLHGKSLEISKKKGVTRIHLSLSHTARYAAAQVVME